MKVFILGRTEILYDAVVALGEAGHDIVAVVTAKASPEYLKREADFESLADTYGAVFLCASRIKGAVEDLARQCNADICISMNWVSILREEFLGIFPHGALNVHFGDLPRYRGNAVTNWAILQGEADIALTVHKMAPGALDAGDIMLKTRMALTGKSTIADINAFARQTVPGMFVDVLNGIDAGVLQPQPQSTTGLDAMRCYARLPRDGWIDWSRSAHDIDALVRSLAKPYSGAYSYWRSEECAIVKVRVWRSRVVAETCMDLGVPGHVIKNDPESGETWVLTGEGIVALLEVTLDDACDSIAPGRVWKSTRMRLGLNVEDELYRLSRVIEGEIKT